MKGLMLLALGTTATVLGCEGVHGGCAEADHCDGDFAVSCAPNVSNPGSHQTSYDCAAQGLACVMIDGSAYCD